MSSEKDSRNFLGQTPLHFAVYKPQYLNELIQSGHDIDAADNYGITPLMYAAATNHEESVTILVNAGADPTIQDSRYQRTFIHYAAVRRNWELIFNFLCQIEAIDGKYQARGWSQLATFLFHVQYPDHLGASGVSFHQVLTKCGGSVNFIFDDWGQGTQGNCLLHYTRSVSDFKALVDNGFNLINHTNSAGRHPLMAAVRQREPSLVTALLEAGSDINLKDTQHRTSLSHALRRRDMEVTNSYLIMDIVRILLDNGANVLERDECRCPCSPGGCLTAVPPSSSASLSWPKRYFSIWELEWLNLLSEHRGADVAKEVLVSFMRKAKHSEMGMTHVCCRSNEDPPIWASAKKISDEDIDEIVDEESEFADILEAEMSHSCEKEYDVLLRDWVSLMKVSLHQKCEEAADRSKRVDDAYKRQVLTSAPSPTVST